MADTGIPAPPRGITVDSDDEQGIPAPPSGITLDSEPSEAPKKLLPEVSQAITAVPKPTVDMQEIHADPTRGRDLFASNQEIADRQAKEAARQKQVVTDARARGVQPAVVPKLGLPEVAGGLTDILAPGTIMPGRLEPDPGQPIAEGVQKLQTPGERTTGALQLGAGALDAAAPLAGPMALESPGTFIRAGAEGYVAGKAGKYAAKAVGANPEQQGYVEDIGQMAPILAHAAIRPEVGIESTPEGTRGAVKGFGGNVAAGAEVTPESVTVGGKVGPFSATKRWVRTQPGEVQSLEPPTIEGNPAAPGAPRTPVQPPPAAAPPGAAPSAAPSPAPVPAPMTEVTAQEIAEVGDQLARLPIEQRAQATLAAHATMADALLKQGKLIGPDGKLQIINNQKQAESFAQKLINEEIARQDAKAKQSVANVPAPPSGITVDEKPAAQVTAGGEVPLPAFKKGDRVTLPNGDSGTIHYLTSNIARVEVPAEGGGTRKVSVSPAKLKPVQAEAGAVEAPAKEGVAVPAVAPKTSKEAIPEPPAGITLDEPAKVENASPAVKEQQEPTLEATDALTKVKAKLRAQFPEASEERIQALVDKADEARKGIQYIQSFGKNGAEPTLEAKGGLTSDVESPHEQERGATPERIIPGKAESGATGIAEGSRPTVAKEASQPAGEDRVAVKDGSASLRGNGEAVGTPSGQEGQAVRQEHSGSGEVPAPVQTIGSAHGGTSVQPRPESVPEQLGGSVPVSKSETPAVHAGSKENASEPTKSEWQQLFEKASAAQPDKVADLRKMSGEQLRAAISAKPEEQAKIDRDLKASKEFSYAYKTNPEKLHVGTDADGGKQFYMPFIEDGKRIGSGHVSARPDIGEGVAETHRVDIDEAHQGKGLAKELYRRLYETAKAQGFTRLVSDSVQEPNARRAWEGMVRRGLAKEFKDPYGETRFEYTGEAAKTGTVGSPEYESLKAKVAALENKQPERLPAWKHSGNGGQIAERLRKSADGMDKQIDDKRREMTQNPTPKRMREYRSRLHDSNNMERVQKAMRVLADAHEAGTVPKELAALRSKDDIHRLVYQGLSGSGGYYDVIPSHERYSNKSPEAKKLQEMMDKQETETSEARAAKEKASKISQLEADVQFQKLPGYFPTPKAIVSKMLDAADIQPGDKVLEPSAGKGDIADAIREQVPEAKLDTVEQQHRLRQILELKGHNLAGQDFLEHAGQYDKIVMNPPFEKGADVDHVRHAFELLKPGGRLVAVMSPHAEFASDKKSTDFRAWVDSLDGTSEKLPEGSFKESGTGVGTRLVVIDKPEAPVAEKAVAVPHREVISTAKKEVSSGARIKGAEGSKTTLLTSGGEQPATFRVVEAGDLIPSHNAQTFAKNPSYPAGVQERAYDTSKEAQNRVIQQSQHFNPDYLINTNPDAVNGPPVITPDGTVLGGNSRAMTVQRVYQNKNFVAYKHVLIREAEKFGLDKEAVRAMSEPVLVREVAAPATQDEMRALGTALNKSMTGALGVSERAVSAGKAITRETLANISGMLDGIGKDASLRDLMRERGKEVLAALVKDGAITERERPQFVDTATGGLSEEGKTFVERALLGSVVDDPRLMDSTPKSVLNKLDGSLAALSSVAPRTDAYNILPLLREALREHGEIAQRGTNVEDYLSQGGLFASERDPAVDALTRVLAGKSLAVRERFRRFAEDANFDAQGQGTLGLIEQPSPAKAFNEAFGSDLSDEDLENSILKAVQSEPTIKADVGEAQTVRPTEAGAGSIQRSQAGEPRPSGESGTRAPEEPKSKSQLEALFSDESGSFEPGKLGEAAGAVAGKAGDYLRSEVKFNKIARGLQSGMYDLESQHSGRVLDAVQNMERVVKEYKKAGGDLLEDAASVYHHLENPEEEGLSKKQDDLLDDEVLPVMQDTDSKFRQLKELMGDSPEGELLANYVHRVTRGKGGWLDRIVSGQKKGTGRGNLLSKSAPQTKGRTMMAIESPSGERRVIAIKGGQATMWQDGEATELGDIKSAKGVGRDTNETFPEGEPNSVFYDEGKIVEGPDGYDWKVTQATTKEIEANTGVRYYHNALASALVSNLQVSKALRGAEFIESFKSSPDFKDIAYKGSKPPDGWKVTQLPQLRDYYFEPHTAEVLDWYADRLKGRDPSIFDKVGNFLRTSIFFNPLVHIPNITVHWGTERGLTGYNPLRAPQAARAGLKAINAVIHQNQDFLDALDAGAPLQSHREDVAKVTQLFFDQLTDGLEKKDDWAVNLAKQIGMSPVTLIKGIYRFSGKATWVTNDIAVLQSAYEKQAKGMSLAEALKETSKHIPDYRLPTRILNSNALAKVLSNPHVTMFMAYHYGAAKSYGEAAKSALGMEEPAAGRSKAGEVGHGWELLATIGLVTFVLYPLLDKLVQAASGDKNARLRRAGAATLPYNIYQAATHQKSAGDVVQSVATPAIQTKAAAELVANREFYTGRNIYDPLADWETQGQQVGRYLMNQISPIGQAARMEEGGAEARKRFAWSLVGVSFPKTRAERIASQIALHKIGTKAEDPAAREDYVERHDILDELRKGNHRPLEKAQQNHELTHRQVENIKHRAHLTPLEDTVNGFSIAEVEQVLAAAKAAKNENQIHELETVLRKKRVRARTYGWQKAQPSEAIQ